MLALILLNQVPTPTYVGPAGSYTVVTPNPTTISFTANSITLSWTASPAPPGPTPALPDHPPPIPVSGLRVLIIYDASQLSKYVPSQTKIFYDNSLRMYLDSVTVLGVDQKTHEYRVWDKDVVLTNEAQLWRDVMARPHPKIPWIVISNGVTGFEGPLPMTTAETIELVKKYVVAK